MVEISDWGCSGNCWIDAEKSIPQKTMVKGCGGGEIFILKKWKGERGMKKGFLERIKEFFLSLLAEILRIFK